MLTEIQEDNKKRRRRMNSHHAPRRLITRVTRKWNDRTGSVCPLGVIQRKVEAGRFISRRSLPESTEAT